MDSRDRSEILSLDTLSQASCQSGTPAMPESPSTERTLGNRDVRRLTSPWTPRACRTRWLPPTRIVDDVSGFVGCQAAGDGHEAEPRTLRRPIQLDEGGVIFHHDADGIAAPEPKRADARRSGSPSASPDCSRLFSVGNISFSAVVKPGTGAQEGGMVKASKRLGDLATARVRSGRPAEDGPGDRQRAAGRDRFGASSQRRQALLGARTHRPIRRLARDPARSLASLLDIQLATAEPLAELVRHRMTADEIHEGNEIMVGRQRRMADVIRSGDGSKAEQAWRTYLERVEYRYLQIIPRDLRLTYDIARGRHRR